MKVFYTLLLCLSTALVYGQEISNDKRIQGHYQTGSTHVDKAIATITASNDIQQRASVEYIAGKSVTLLPGFKANRSVVFSAIILPLNLLNVKADASLERMGLSIHPNPVEEMLNITYSLDKRTEVTLTITDEMGNIVAKILDGEIKGEGVYKQEWKSSLLKTGLYICTIQTNTNASSVKLIKR